MLKRTIVFAAFAGLASTVMAPAPANAAVICADHSHIGTGRGGSESQAMKLARTRWYSVARADGHPSSGPLSRLSWSLARKRRLTCAKPTFGVAYLFYCKATAIPCHTPPKDKPKKTRPSTTGTMNPVPMKLFCQKGETKYQSAGHIPKGWTSRKVTLGNVTIYCAKPVKPLCKGGKLIMLKSMPAQWRCICPQGWRKVRGKCTKNKPKTGPTINKNRIQ